MRDAVAGGHEIDRARLDPREGAERITVIDRAPEQISDGGEVDVRVGADVDPGAGIEVRRAHLIEEDEGADHRAWARGQGAVDLEAAEIVRGWSDGLEDEIVVRHAASSSG